MTPRNTVLVRGMAREEDALADEAITPGMLVELTATGVQRHNAAGGVATPIFAREQKENQGADIHDEIASGDYVTCLYPKLGDVINAYTEDTIALGGWVESDGDGGVRAYGSGYRIGQARKASDFSGTTGRVEIIINPIGA